VFDARRVHLDENDALSQVRVEMKKRRFKAVLFITKAGTVLEIRPS